MNSSLALHADESIITPRVSIDPTVLTIAFHEPGQQDIYAAMDVKIFGTITQFEDLGYAIVKAIRELRREGETEIDFGESLEANVPVDAEPTFVPFAINDAVEHDEAMGNIGELDPDLAERL